MEKNFFIPLTNKKEFLYVIAISGGPDSTFLLYKMYYLGYKVVAAHVNYGKRCDSLYDEKLVAEHCEKLSIRLFVEKATNHKKGNFQANARNLRYKFFLQIAERLSNEGFKVGGIVVAHNFEDLLETYQLQKERKSLVSYWGLPVQSQFAKGLVFRPIINFRKKGIVKFLTQEGIRYSTDYTNDTEIYRRNVIRKMIFALGAEKKKLLSEQIKKENILLLQSIREVNRKIKMLFSGDALHIDSKEGILSKVEIKQRIIYALLNEFSGNKFFSPKKRLVTEVCKQLQSRKKELTINLGNEIKIVKRGKMVLFKKGE